MPSTRITCRQERNVSSRVFQGMFLNLRQVSTESGHASNSGAVTGGRAALLLLLLPGK